MKKVCVSTYCELTSYGSILQAFALKRHLNALGCEVSHVKIEKNHQERTQIYYKGKNIKIFLINIGRFLRRKQIRRRYELLLRFFDKNFNFIRYVNYEQLKANPPEADLYITGSDQVWNPNAMKPFFFLDFVKESEKKMSYAASMGVSKIDATKKSQWFDAVRSFAYISVREQEMQQLIQNEIDRNVSIHIDPTFLISKEEWKAISKAYSIQQPYILVYALYWDKKFNMQLKELHKKTGLPVVAITSELQRVYAQKKLYDVSVEEFLWLFDHAEYVITSSFHGAAFSIIFEKKFSLIIDPQKPSRLNSLLNTFGVKNTSIFDLPGAATQNYQQVQEIIKHERTKTDEYLCQGI